MVKCRTQIQQKSNDDDCQLCFLLFLITIFLYQYVEIGPLRILKDAYAENGFRGIFRGLSSTIARDVPFNFAFFGAYEAWTTLLSSTGSRLFCSPNSIADRRSQNFTEAPKTDRRLNPFGVYIAGGCAGASGWMVSFPIDSVKSRVQTSKTPTSLVSMAKTIYKKFGVRGFFRGVSSAVLRAFPANAGLFLGYEMVIEVLS